MKPDWDKLGSAFTDSDKVLIADVDCDGGGSSKCEEVGIKSFPTIKHGDPYDLQDYKGQRDYESLLEFAQALGPVCGPGHVELCE